MRIDPDGTTVDGLECPSCGGEYLHHKQVWVYERDAEDGPGTVVLVKGSADVRVERRPADELPGRRDSLMVQFFCENCDAEPTMMVEQHKGQTLLHWHG